MLCQRTIQEKAECVDSNSISSWKSCNVANPPPLAPKNFRPDGHGKQDTKSGSKGCDDAGRPVDVQVAQRAKSWVALGGWCG
uniref:HDC10999 n=1 Tax=Drosophila melanogaster TaxID=7227 RepID=Q6IKZ0_DROME|nr:TPA_inf: HDC10999 [Drosophila melanogaster]